MAEIPVVQKTELPLWAAILGLVALTMVIWLLFSLAPDGVPSGS